MSRIKTVMPVANLLKLMDKGASNGGDPAINIIVVPAINADISSQLNPPRPNSWLSTPERNIFKSVDNAKVWLFRYPPAKHVYLKSFTDLLPPKDRDLASDKEEQTWPLVHYYAYHLATAIDECVDNELPIHFAASSSGGFVVKQVLLPTTYIAAETSQSLVRRVASLAFFGTPHHGLQQLCTYEIPDGLLSNRPASSRTEVERSIISPRNPALNVPWLATIHLPVELSRRTGNGGLLASQEQLNDSCRRREIEEIYELQDAFMQALGPCGFSPDMVWSFVESETTSIRIETQPSTPSSTPQIFVPLETARIRNVTTSEVNEVVTHLDMSHLNLAMFGPFGNSKALEPYLEHFKALEFGTRTRLIPFDVKINEYMAKRVREELEYRAFQGSMEPVRRIMPEYNDITNEISMTAWRFTSSHWLKTIADKDVLTSAHEVETTDWIDLHANKVAWVKKLLSHFDRSYIAENPEKPAISTRDLDKSRWEGREMNNDWRSRAQRYMKNTAEIYWRCRGPTESLNFSSDSGSVIYIPYLWTEFVEDLTKRKSILEDRMHAKTLHRPEHHGGVKHDYWFEKLIWDHPWNTETVPSFHLRRTLDQFGYPSLLDTSSRDKDQILYKWHLRVKSKWAKAGEIRPGLRERLSRAMGQFPQNSGEKVLPKMRLIDRTTSDPSTSILMIEQLWCLTLGKDAIITTSPKISDKDIAPEIRRNCGRFPGRRTSWEVAAAAVLSAVEGAFATVISHERFSRLAVSDDPDHKPLQIYKRYLEFIIDVQTLSSQQFQIEVGKASNDSNEDAASPNASEDIYALLELHDIDNELDILTRLLDEQHEVVVKMRDKKVWRVTSEAFDGYMKEASELLDTHYTTIARLRKDCASAIKTYEKLIDLKQRQASVDEARLSRKSAEEVAKQSRTLFVFTIFTVIFLPLSFMTSVFGMNTREWNESGSYPRLRTVTIVLVSVGIATLIATMIIVSMETLKEIWSVCVEILPLFLKMLKERRNKTVQKMEKKTNGDIEKGQNGKVE